MSARTYGSRVERRITRSTMSIEERHRGILSHQTIGTERAAMVRRAAWPSLEHLKPKPPSPRGRGVWGEAGRTSAHGLGESSTSAPPPPAPLPAGEGRVPAIPTAQDGVKGSRDCGRTPYKALGRTTIRSCAAGAGRAAWRTAPRDDRKGWTKAGRTGRRRRCSRCSDCEAFPSWPPCPSGSRRWEQFAKRRGCMRRWNIVTMRIIYGWT